MAGFELTDQLYQVRSTPGLALDHRGDRQYSSTAVDCTPTLCSYLVVRQYDGSITS